MAPSKRKNLLIRTVTGIVILCPALWAIHAGAPYFNILLAVFGGAMAWEWVRLCNHDRFNFAGVLFAGTIIAICLLPFWSVGSFGLSYVLLLATSVIVFLFNPRCLARYLLSFGVIYVGVALLGFLMLREQDWSLVAWLCTCVIATDTGAYLVGSTIGGPKIAPKVSPNKTWSGLIGGIIAASGASLIFAKSFTWQEPMLLVGLAAILAIIAQAGDFFESYMKRRFNKKDSSQLIPGHGGVLDRMDGMISASLFFSLLILSSQGAILLWF